MALIPQELIITYTEWFWLWPGIAALLLFNYLRRTTVKNTGLINGELERSILLRHPLTKLFRKPETEKSPRSFASYLYQLTIFSLLIFALAQPVQQGKRLPDPPRERDIVFIIDTSVSMILRDYELEGKRIDRMTLLKGFLGRFIRQLHGERISLIVFADSAYTLVPLSRDQQLLQRMLQRIEPSIAGRFKAVGEGVALAVKQSQPGPQDKQGKRQRILILLTDASQPSGLIKPHAAAEIARQAGLPLYTIAIGASSYSAEEQRLAGLIYHPADILLLEKMAQHTGAKFYQAGDADALQAAVNAISKTGKNVQQASPQYYQQPLYHWPLLVAMMLVIVRQLLSSLRGVRA